MRLLVVLTALILPGWLGGSCARTWAADEDPKPEERRELEQGDKDLDAQAKKLFAEGKHIAAQKSFEQLLEIRRRLYPEARYPDGHPKLATSINNVGVSTLRQEGCARAEPFFRDALMMRRKLYPAARFPDGHLDLARSLQNLGATLQDQGEYARAEPLLREALTMTRKLYPEARFPDGHYQLAISLNSLGALLQARGESAKAEPLARDALMMRRKLYPAARFPDGHPELATSLSNLGNSLQEQREHARAEPLYRDALLMNRKLYPEARFPDGHPQLANSLNNLGFLLQARGDYAGAETLWRDALRMRQKLYPAARYPDGHPQLANDLSNLGSLLYAGGEYAGAEPLLRDALRMNEDLLRAHADLTSEAEALNRLANFPLTRDVFLTLCRHLPPRPEHYLPIWRARAALTRLLERRHLDTAGSQDEETRRLALELRGARERLARLVVHPLPDPKDHAERLQRLTGEKEAQERRLAQRLQLTLPPRKADALTPEELAASLPLHTAFVDLIRYVSFDQDPKVPGEKGLTRTPRYVAFVLRKGQPTRRVELGEAKRIEDALREWRREIADWRSGHPVAASSAAQRLSAMLWQPLAKHIPSDTETIFLAPDAGLTGLPWAALPGRDKGKVLLEEHALVQVPHGPWLLERLRARPAPRDGPGTLLALGAVAYDGAPKLPDKPRSQDLIAQAPTRGGGGRASWDYLKGTERELDQILARAGTRDVIALRGSDASIDRLRQDLPKARFAHLATHGFFDDRGTRSVLQLTEEDYRQRGDSGERVGVGKRSPLLLSGLVLAGANRKAKDKPETWAEDGGILLGEELVGLNLHGLELAVLSACETGLGDVGGGEGVYGLARAFHVAGCTNVVASLWQVDDEATAALMTLFYTRLWSGEKGMTPARALREAQLSLYRHPERIAAWSKERGPTGKVVKIEGYTPAAKPDGKATGTAHPKLWAGFVLSGLGQ